MVAKLCAKPGGDAIPVTIGNFAEVAVDGTYDLIFVVFNTLFALTSQEEQVRCFENVARHLTPGGVFVVEAFCRTRHLYVDGQALRTLQVTTDSVRLMAATQNRAAQMIQAQTVVVTAEGIRLYPVNLRYAWPSEIESYEQAAGGAQTAESVERVGPVHLHGGEYGPCIGVWAAGGPAANRLTTTGKRSKLRLALQVHIARSIGSRHPQILADSHRPQHLRRLDLQRRVRRAWRR